jgi:methenyltetrahydromethanopterin cyclohydrolase
VNASLSDRVATTIMTHAAPSPSTATTGASGLSLNDRAKEIADDMVARAAELRVRSFMLANGARVIDAGIDSRGGYGAGIGLAEACMGGLGRIVYQSVEIDGESFQGVQVWTDHPAVSCMASQYAGWAIKAGEFFAMGSGPLRAHARVEKELFAKLKYQETASHGVIVLETRAHPTEDVASWIATRCNMQPAQLTILVAPTASLAGGVQVVARIIETGLHKMDTIGFDVKRVVVGMGTAPLPAVAKSDLRAIGHTNDCILYGGRAYYVIDAEDDELEALAAKLPATSSSDYGTPFYDTFKRYNNDFYKIDPLLFSPAEVWLTSSTTGRTFHGGHLNGEVLKQSLFG